eukprot:TRINITY_DN114_c0_g1_i5.p1 TRINITY_DN114_c0_g1~~TRINITY_DN114_c0_g1_i5.p1  ORF type:complete len:712 (+),score=213.94 TRINITY_DN114_c0_g1_i5:239-2374(+)
MDPRHAAPLCGLPDRRASPYRSPSHDKFKDKDKHRSGHHHRSHHHGHHDDSPHHRDHRHHDHHHHHHHSKQGRAVHQQRHSVSPYPNAQLLSPDMFGRQRSESIPVGVPYVASPSPSPRLSLPPGTATATGASRNDPGAGGSSSSCTTTSSGSSSGSDSCESSYSSEGSVSIHSSDEEHRHHEPDFASAKAASYAAAPPQPMLDTTVSASLSCKIWIENYYEKLIQGMKEHEKRRELLEQQMDLKHLSKKERSGLRKQLAQLEGVYLRMKRSKMTLSDFNVISVIGRGAFGEVLLARKKDTNELVAVKKLLKKKMLKKNQMAHVRAERDVLVAAHNDNPWVVKLLYSFQDEEYLYLVMEFLPGGDMMSLLIKYDIFSENQTRFYVVELLLAIESVHANGYIHRDIKPDNLIFDHQGHLKLTDFGLCTGFHKMHSTEFYNKILKEAKKKQLKNITDRKYDRVRHRRVMAYSTVGTPDYTCPEVINEIGYGAECDFWSVGCILFEMLAGYPPFAADSSSETCHNISNWRQTFEFPKDKQFSPEAKDLISRLLCDKEHRLGYQTGVTEIKAHPFFKGVVWENFRETTKPPFIPELRNSEDLSNFDRSETHANSTEDAGDDDDDDDDCDDDDDVDDDEDEDDEDDEDDDEDDDDDDDDDEDDEDDEDDDDNDDDDDDNDNATFCETGWHETKKESSQPTVPTRKQPSTQTKSNTC